jgi:hypothetical protein
LPEIVKTPIYQSFLQATGLGFILKPAAAAVCNSLRKAKLGHFRKFFESLSPENSLAGNFCRTPRANTGELLRESGNGNQSE